MNEKDRLRFAKHGDRLVEYDSEVAYAIQSGKCIGCGLYITQTKKFVDPDTIKEYQESALCQNCQEERGMRW